MYNSIWWFYKTFCPKGSFPSKIYKTWTHLCSSKVLISLQRHQQWNVSLFARILGCRCGLPKLTSWEEQKINSWKHHMLCYPVLSYARNCWEFDGLTWTFWWKMLVFCIFPGFNMVLECKLWVKKLLFGRIIWVQTVSTRTTVEIIVCSPDPIL